MTLVREVIAYYKHGNVKVNSAPRPGSLVTVIVPPCSSTICLAIANPNPLPLVDRARERDLSPRQKRSKT